MYVCKQEHANKRIRFRLEDAYLSTETSTVPGSQVDPMYKRPSGDRIIEGIEKKRGKRE